MAPKQGIWYCFPNYSKGFIAPSPSLELIVSFACLEFERCDGTLKIASDIRFDFSSVPCVLKFY